MAMEFIDASLSCSGSSKHALSYKDSTDQRWTIREHVLSVLRDFPTLEPSWGPFTHDDGTTVNLLNISGHITIPRSSTSVPIILWVHENYPFVPPMTFVVTNPDYRIRNGHPHVDMSSGLVSSPYLLMWKEHDNLTKLLRNMVNLFSLNHPLENHGPTTTLSMFSHPSLVSKQEAIDRLTVQIHYDTFISIHETTKDIEPLSVLQQTMSDRADIATSAIVSLEEEKHGLETTLNEAINRSKALSQWMHDINGRLTNHDDQDDGYFVCGDEEDDRVMGYMADDMAIDDVIYELEKAFNHGVIPFKVYIKHVRDLSKQQFFNRALLVKLRGPQILNRYS